MQYIIQEEEENNPQVGIKNNTHIFVYVMFCICIVLVNHERALPVGKSANTEIMHDRLFRLWKVVMELRGIYTHGIMFVYNKYNIIYE